MSRDADLLLNYLGNVLYDQKNAALDLDELSPDCRLLGEGILFFAQCVMDAQRFATDISRGDLSTPMPSPENELAYPLKGLHASLRHLTWQTKQVAKGDYKQRVDFMGEFAEAFNSMTEQLERQHKALLTELEHSNLTVEKGREQIRYLENYAYEDKLTGTHNRHYGMNLLEKWLAQGLQFCLCFIDLDNLKYVNDSFGHAEGDIYLMDVAQNLKELASNAAVCRLGGDEFMILVQGLGQQEAEQLLEIVRLRLTEDSSTPYPRSISYGVVQVTKENNSQSADLLSLADERMYQFKRAHKKQRQDALSPLAENAE